MDELYFPKSLYVEAHEAYLVDTGKDVNDVMEYCLRDNSFFIEIVFSYVDKTPWPLMKESA